MIKLRKNTIKGQKGTIDLFRLYILFFQYRLCDNTQEVWSFVFFIKKSAADIFMLAYTLFKEQKKAQRRLNRRQAGKGDSLHKVVVG